MSALEVVIDGHEVEPKTLVAGDRVVVVNELEGVKAIVEGEVDHASPHAIDIGYYSFEAEEWEDHCTFYKVARPLPTKPGTVIEGDGKRYALVGGSWRNIQNDWAVRSEEITNWTLVLDGVES